MGSDLYFIACIHIATLVSDAGQTENSSSESETEYTKLKGFGEGNCY